MLEQRLTRHERHEPRDRRVSGARDDDALVGGEAVDTPAPRPLSSGITLDAVASRVLPVPARSRNLLAVGPGHRQLTCTPVPRASSHSASENDSTNAFDA